MDDSNGSNDSGGSGGGNDRPNNQTTAGHGQKRDLIYAENMRQRMAEQSKRLSFQKEAISRLRKPYEAEADGQMRQAMGYAGQGSDGGSGGLLSGLIGNNATMVHMRGKSMVASLAGINGRSLESSEVQAVADYVTTTMRTTSMIQWGSMGFIVAATIPRWRKVPPYMRASRVMSYSWPFLLMLGYSIPVQLFFEPLLLTIYSAYQSNKFVADPRLANLNVDLQGALAQMTETLAKAQSQDAADGSSPQQQYDSWAQDQSQGRSPILAAASSSSYSSSPWSSDAQRESSREEQKPSDSWDSTSIVDDASPVASSHSQSAGGSSWDRLRQQSNQQARYASRQVQPSQRTPSQDGWGGGQASEGYGDSRQQAGSFAPSDTSRTPSKDKAQQEFDRMLEQERQGADAENRRWR